MGVKPLHGDRILLPTCANQAATAGSTGCCIGG